jgi:PKD repeat protein
MSATPSTGTLPLTVTFDGSRSADPDGTVSSWAWSFGDGTSATGPATSHLYSLPGTYAASLTVTDDGGASSTTTSAIVVNTLVLPAPSGLTATALTRNSIRLTWTNGSTGPTEVQVERGQGLGCRSFSQVGAVAGTAKTFTDSGLAPRTKYRYRVRAHSALGDSLYSNTASARTKR